MEQMKYFCDFCDREIIDYNCEKKNYSQHGNGFAPLMIYLSSIKIDHIHLACLNKLDTLITTFINTNNKEKSYGAK